MFCKIHKCPANGCTNQKTEDDFFCTYHQCDTSHCENQTVASARTCERHACAVLGCAFPAHRKTVRSKLPWMRDVIIGTARCEMHACKFPGCDQQPHAMSAYCVAHPPQHVETMTEVEDTDDRWLKHVGTQTDPVKLEVRNLQAPPKQMPRIGGGYMLPVTVPARVLEAEYSIIGPGHSGEAVTVMPDDFLKVMDEPPPGPTIAGTEYGFGESGKMRNNRFGYAVFEREEKLGISDSVVSEVVSGVSGARPSSAGSQRVFRVLRPMTPNRNFATNT